MSEHLATVVLTTGDNGVEAKVNTELDESELGGLLVAIGEQMARTASARPRESSCWGAES